MGVDRPTRDEPTRPLPKRQGTSGSSRFPTFPERWLPRAVTIRLRPSPGWSSLRHFTCPTTASMSTSDHRAARPAPRHHSARCRESALLADDLSRVTDTVTRQGGHFAVLLGGGAGGDGQLKRTKFTELRRAIEHENFAGDELRCTRLVRRIPLDHLPELVGGAHRDDVRADGKLGCCVRCTAPTRRSARTPGARGTGEDQDSYPTGPHVSTVVSSSTAGLDGKRGQGDIRDTGTPRDAGGRVGLGPTGNTRMGLGSTGLPDGRRATAPAKGRGRDAAIRLRQGNRPGWAISRAPHPTHRRFTRMGDRGHNRGSTFKALPNPTRVLPQARRLLPGRGVACGVRRCSGPWRVRTQAPTPNSSVQSCRRNHRVTTTEQGAFLTT